MSSGAIKRKTPTFGLNIINYDFPRWHTFDWQNWDTLDAVLKAAGLTAVKGIWQNNTSYLVGDRVVDDASSTIWICSVAHTSAASGSFSDDRIAYPSYWKTVSSVPIDRGNWATAVVYNTWDIVKYNNAYYACTVQHTSAAFATDLAAGKWTLIFDLQPALDAQTAAELAETNAETAESNASGYATAALGSKNAAAISESNAGTSEYNAGVSEGIAVASANDALGYKNTADTKATEALNSATLAGQWATSLALVDGANYGAKKYAIDAAGSAAAAATFDPALYVKKDGTTVMAGLSIYASWPTIKIRKSGNGEANLITGYNSADFLRWSVAFGDETLETGSGNTGSDFKIHAFDDAGNLLSTPVSIDRATGITTLDSRPVFGTATPWDSDNAALAGMLAFFVMESAPTGWLKANGAAVSLTTYPNLINIYCGDTNNATAIHGYRCTNPASPSSTRSTSGDYIVLPDARGEFIRGLDDGRGVDTGRSTWQAQTDLVKAHTHPISDPTHSHNATQIIIGPGSVQMQTAPGSAGLSTQVNYAATGITVQANTGAENRPRNLAPLACIKY